MGRGIPVFLYSDAKLIKKGKKEKENCHFVWDNGLMTIKKWIEICEKERNFLILHSETQK